jgi:uncharacterized RDD family membrane protein YckC
VANKHGEKARAPADLGPLCHAARVSDPTPPDGKAPGDPAPVWRRLVARLIDTVLVAVVAAGLAQALGIHVFHHTTSVSSNGSVSKRFRFSVSDAIFFKWVAVELVLSALYEIPLIAVRGATLAKAALGVRVVQVESRQPPKVGPAAIRWAIVAVSSVIPIAGFVLVFLLFLSPFFDPTKRNRGWHDRAAKTIVIRARQRELRTTEF